MQRITPQVSTDLRSEPPPTQPSSSLHAIQTMGQPGLPLPIPGEGRGPVAQSLPHWRRRLPHCLEDPNRLRGLTP
jgi:hypothetical protein